MLRHELNSGRPEGARRPWLMEFAVGRDTRPASVREFPQRNGRDIHPQMPLEGWHAAHVLVSAGLPASQRHSEVIGAASRHNTWGAGVPDFRPRPSAVASSADHQAED